MVDVITESPAEKQGVRAGSRLAKINGMHVESRFFGKGDSGWENFTGEAA